MHASFARNSVRTAALAVKAGSPLVGAFILSCYLVPVVVVAVGTGILMLTTSPLYKLREQALAAAPVLARRYATAKPGLFLQSFSCCHRN